jgi:hypothetical protein
MKAMRDYMWTLGVPQMAKLAQPADPTASAEPAPEGVETPAESPQPVPPEPADTPQEAPSEETAEVETEGTRPAT